MFLLFLYNMRLFGAQKQLFFPAADHHSSVKGNTDFHPRYLYLY
jgi:hypothetical protein